MCGAASNQYKALPLAIERLVAVVFGTGQTFPRRVVQLLFAAIAALCFAPGAHAADVGLGISFSPEAARVIRDWRRAHGLPQAPEADDLKAPLSSSNAIEKAIRCAGLQDAIRDDLVVAAAHLPSRWQVTIHVANTPNNSDYVIEVADAVANSLDATRKRS
jgi:hypothetical protein